MIAPAFWDRRPPTPTARLLAPLGAIYGAATAWRMGRRGQAAPVPVICVGNFVAGGAGKTPAAIEIAKLLRRAGERPAFLSRGYGGARRAETLAVDANIHDAAFVGDEPLLLARIAPCFVGVDRVASARAACEAGASVLVLDDGLQNSALAKDFVFVVSDAQYGFGNGLCVPAGPLRAPLRAQARHVSAAIEIGAPGPVDWLGPHLPGRPHFRARLEADAVAASAFVGRPVYAFAGIARPEKFFATLKTIGANVVKTAAFADHQAFDPRRLSAILEESSRRSLTPVTTEKDWVRLPSEFKNRIDVLPVKLRFEEPRGVLGLMTAAIAAARSGRISRL